MEKKAVPKREHVTYLPMEDWIVEVGPTLNGGDKWLHIQVRTKSQFSSMAFVVMTDGLNVTAAKTPDGRYDIFMLVASLPTHVTINLVGRIEHKGKWPK